MSAQPFDDSPEAIKKVWEAYIVGLGHDLYDAAEPAAVIEWDGEGEETTYF